MKNNVCHLILLSIIILAVSCAPQREVLLGDVICFANDAQTSYKHTGGKLKNLFPQGEPYLLYAPVEGTSQKDSLEAFGVRFNNEKNMLDFIDTRKIEETDARTAAFYAMDIALDRINYVRKHEPLKHNRDAEYNIIYMTDGLDNISVQVAKNRKQRWFLNNEKTYKKRIERKIKRIARRCRRRNLNAFNIYPAVYFGQDLQSVPNLNKQFIENHMQWARGSSMGKDKAPKVIVEEDFDTIVQKIGEELAIKGFDFYIPKGYKDKRVDMTFSDGKNEGHLKGDLKKFLKRYSLKNVELTPNNFTLSYKYKNRSSKRPIANNKDTTTKAWFSVVTPSFPIEKQSQHVRHFIDNKEVWIKNTEYTPHPLGHATYFILVFDASGSLLIDKQGNIPFEREKNAAKKAVDIFANKATNIADKVEK